MNERNPGAELLASVEQGDAQAVERLLAEGAPVGYQDANGRTPLMAATQKNDVGFSAIFRFVINPLFLFSGTFFPLTQLPEPLRPRVVHPELALEIDLAGRVAALLEDCDRLFWRFARRDPRRPESQFSHRPNASC